MQNKRYEFVYTDREGNDQCKFINALSYARAYDKFWSIMDGEDIKDIEVEEHTLQPVEGLEEVYEWVPSPS